MSDINSHNILNQILIKKICCFGTSLLGDDIYYLFEFVRICIEDFGEPNLIQMLKEDNSRNKERLNKLGNEWESFKITMKHIGKKLSQLKLFYDRVNEKKFKQIEDKSMSDFLSASTRLSLIQENLYALFIFFISHSRIKLGKITTQDWKVLQYVDLKKVSNVPKRPDYVDTSKTKEVKSNDNN